MASKWDTQWTTLLGMRNDTVWTNAGPVQGYSSDRRSMATMPHAFNALNRAQNRCRISMRRHWRATSRTRRALTSSATRARHARPIFTSATPGLQTWMASGMIGWFGDGNYYVGNVGLKPEIAQHRERHGKLA